MKEFFKNLDPALKKKMLLIVVITFVSIIAIGGYLKRLDKRELSEAEKPAEIRKLGLVGDDLMEKSVYLNSNQKLRELEEKYDEKFKIVEEELKKKIYTVPTTTSGNNQQQSPDPSAEAPSNAALNQNYPPSPNTRLLTDQTKVRRYDLNQKQKKVPQDITTSQPKELTQSGEIESRSFVTAEKEAEKTVPEKKNQLIIPSSTFMEGVLLSGVHAPCTSFGKEEPTIMIIKVQKPAILPNDVKANLKGCFVQVEGVCQLSTERVKTRLRRISCMSKESASVIDQQIKGYVTDEDGILGLKGRVVAKFSDALSRTFFAELISGLGRGTSESMTTTTTSSVTGEESATVDPKNIGMVGLGRGLEGAGSMVSKFYLDLAKQMVPAMEIGAMKKLHVVITEPVVLKVSEFE